MRPGKVFHADWQGALRPGRSRAGEGSGLDDNYPRFITGSRVPAYSPQTCEPCYSRQTPHGVGAKGRALIVNTALDGSSIHSASSELKVYFQAGVNIKGIEPDLDHTHVTFTALIGKSWVVEASSALGTNSNWTPVNAPVAGDDYFHEITDDQEMGGQRFYRTKGQSARARQIRRGEGGMPSPRH